MVRRWSLISEIAISELEVEELKMEPDKEQAHQRNSRVTCPAAKAGEAGLRSYSKHVRKRMQEMQLPSRRERRERRRERRRFVDVVGRVCSWMVEQRKMQKTQMETGDLLW